MRQGGHGRRHAILGTRGSDERTAREAGSAPARPALPYLGWAEAGKAKGKQAVLKLPNKKYSIIYADPPWLAHTWRGRQAPYETMATEDICRLPVRSICDSLGGVLFLWIIWSQLRDAFTVMERWGFAYKRVGFVWVKMDKSGKPALGLGQWTRNNSEVCLLGVRGVHPCRVDASVSEIVLCPRLRHSQKPPIIRDKIVQLMGDIPRIELFARERVLGWDAWGDQC